MQWVQNSVTDIVSGYLDFLLLKSRDHERRFRQLVHAQPQAARAEAAVFSFLRQQRLRPVVAEVVGEGGVDFLCGPGSPENFVVEVTSLDDEALAKKSGWLDVIEDGVGSFRLVTNVLRRKASGKTPQLAGYPMPRVLAFVSSHVGSDAFVGTIAAQSLMTGDIKISVPLGGTAEPKEVTDFSDSVFIRFDKKGHVVACRHSISAILLVALFDSAMKLVGMLHPEPRFAFEIPTFPEVPFLRAKAWPILEGKIETEWIIAHPQSALFHHFPIAITNEELKGEE